MAYSFKAANQTYSLTESGVSRAFTQNLSPQINQDPFSQLFQSWLKFSYHREKA